MAAFSKFNTFVADLANKVHNLGSDSLKIMLTNTAPSASNAVKADITDISAGNGYTAGGNAVGISSSTQSGGTYKLIPSGNVAFTASGGPVGPFRYGVLYNNTPASKNLIAYTDYGSSLTIADGATFTFGLDGTNGIVQIT